MQLSEYIYLQGKSRMSTNPITFCLFIAHCIWFLSLHFLLLNVLHAPFSDIHWRLEFFGLDAMYVELSHNFGYVLCTFEGTLTQILKKFYSCWKIDVIFFSKKNQNFFLREAETWKLTCRRFICPSKRLCPCKGAWCGPPCFQKLTVHWILIVSVSQQSYATVWKCSIILFIYNL